MSGEAFDSCRGPSAKGLSETGGWHNRLYNGTGPATRLQAAFNLRPAICVHLWIVRPTFVGLRRSFALVPGTKKAATSSLFLTASTLAFFFAATTWSRSQSVASENGDRWREAVGKRGGVGAARGLRLGRLGLGLDLFDNDGAPEEARVGVGHRARLGLGRGAVLEHAGDGAVGPRGARQLGDLVLAVAPQVQVEVRRSLDAREAVDVELVAGFELGGVASPGRRSSQLTLEMNGQPTTPASLGVQSGAGAARTPPPAPGATMGGFACVRLHRAFITSSPWSFFFRPCWTQFLFFPLGYFSTCDFFGSGVFGAGAFFGGASVLFSFFGSAGGAR